jgi:GTP cyclohydrolase IA
MKEPKNKTKTTPLLEWEKIVLDNNEKAISILENRQEEITKAFKEILSSYQTNSGGVLKKIAETGSFGGLACEAGIKFMSMCRHHFLPFFGTANIVYEPGDHIIGLGKISRLVQVFAKRLQFQEKTF